MTSSDRDPRQLFAEKSPYTGITGMKKDQDNVFGLGGAKRFLTMILLLACWTAGRPAGAAVKGVLALHGPRLYMTPAGESLRFEWDFRSVPDTAAQPVIRYEIQFWSKWKQFFKTFIVYPEDSSGRGELTVETYREIFRRHGRYFWRVFAFDEWENRTQSEPRSFTVPVPSIRERLSDWIYPYRMYAEYNHRLRSDEYLAFVNEASPTVHLRSFSEIGLGFRQVLWEDRLFEVQEQLYLFSNTGMGMEWSTGFRVHQNAYFALIPRIRADIGWFSTGLEEFDSRQNSLFLGADISLMPNGFVVLRGGYVPSFRIRYQLREGGIRTYEGNGYEWGLRFYIPRTVINLFNLAGLELDMQKIPFEFSVFASKDSYTGTVMHSRRLTVSYLFR